MFYFVFKGNFQVQAPRGAYFWRGDLTEGFLRYESGGGLYLQGLIFGILRYKYWTEINVVTQNEIQNKKIFPWLILNSFGGITEVRR